MTHFFTAARVSKRNFSPAGTARVSKREHFSRHGAGRVSDLIWSLFSGFVNNRLLLVFLLISLPATNQTATYRIAGQIVRATDNQVIKAAQVTIYQVANRNRFISALTGADGSFSFSGLTPGKYGLRASAHGWSQDYLQHREFSTAIVVGPGLDSEHIQFAVDAPGKISGVVQDDGEPVSQVMVYLFNKGVFRGHAETVLAETRTTDTAGRFQFAHLHAGTYYLAIVGRPWYARPPNVPNPQQANIDQSTPLPRSDLDVSYPVTYYDGASNFQAATPLKLLQGGNAEVQFNLNAVPAVHVRLEGFTTDPNEFVQTNVYQRGPGGSLISVPEIRAGPELQGLAPGDYLVSASRNGAKQLDFGTQTLNLQTDVTINPGEFTRTTVSGKALTTSGQLAKGLAFVLRSLSGSGQFAGWVTPDGSFTVADIPLPGRYELLLANSADSYVRSVRVSGCTYSNGVLDIAQGAHINIEVLIAQDLSKVEGVAVTGDRPTPAAMVLAIRQGSNDARVFPQDQSDSDGTFSLNAVPPGRYIVVAIDNGEDLEYANPKVIVPYLAHGQVVDVPLAAGQRVRVQVQHRM